MLLMAAKTFGKFSQEEEKQNQDFSEKEKKLAPKMMEEIFKMFPGVLGRQDEVSNFVRSFQLIVDSLSCESAAKLEAQNVDIAGKDLVGRALETTYT